MKLIKLFSGLSAVGVVALGLTPIASCSKNARDKYSQLTQRFVDILIDLDKVPRCTSKSIKPNLDGIRKWITDQAKSCGINGQDIVTDDYGNIWFDVSASKGYENYKPLIIQGHMDMVVAGLTDQTKATTPIEAVADWDKAIMHSKDYKTSLGADDGIALAAVFTLLKDNTFKHGPLRIIFTGDEDTGMLGAAWIASHTPQLLQKMGKNFDGQAIENLLNIDWEMIGEYGRSCAGSVTFTFGSDEITPVAETAKTNKFYIDMRGLAGGHSGSDLIKDRANADKSIYWLFNSIIKTNPGTIQLVRHWHPDAEEKNISFARNQIVPYARVSFNTSLQKSVFENAINTCVAEWKEIYKGEDWSKVSIKVVEDTQVHDKWLTASQSDEFIKVVGQNKSPEPNSNDDKSIFYGYKNRDDGKLDMSQNVSPVTIEYNTQTKKYVATAVSQIRSMTTDLLDKLKAYYADLTLFTVNPAESSYYPAWENNELKENKMLNIVSKAFESVKVTPKAVDSSGGIENAWWAFCNPNLNLSSIGTTIDDAHSTKETLHIDTIQPILDATKYVVEAMKK